MFPSIVSTSIYEQAQRLRLQKQTKQTPSDNQLKQKIKCPCCNATLTNILTIRKKNHTLRYYIIVLNIWNAHALSVISKGHSIDAQRLKIKYYEKCTSLSKSTHTQKLKVRLTTHKRQRNMRKTSQRRVD